MPGFIRTILSLSVLVMLFAGPAMAHKINVFAYAESGQVKTESYFADGRPVKQSRVMVYDSNDNLLLEGKTDNDGLFIFAIPKIADLKIVVREILGHRNSFILKKSEIEANRVMEKGDN